MITRYYKLDPINPDPEKIRFAAECIRRGRLVAFPTETVYGLGANAFDRTAISRIFQVKGRPQDNPLIVHISDKSQIFELTSKVTETAIKLIDNFWPGPLTIVLHRKKGLVSDEITGGLDTVAIRMPDHFLALRLVEESGFPVVAPSANLSGKPSPTSGLHVLRDLAGKIDLVIDGGYTRVGLESTVVDCAGPTPKILRPGGLTREEMVEKVGEVDIDPGIAKEGISPASPGLKYMHYAPEGNVSLVDTEGKTFEDVVKEIDGHVSQFYSAGNTTVVLAFEDTLEALENKPYYHFSLGSRKSLQFAASKIFQLLRRCDRLKATNIIIEGCPREGIGLALMNRLEKTVRH